MKKEKMKRLRWGEVKLTVEGKFMYNGHQMIDVRELPNGDDVMQFCDENKKPLPGSPSFIVGQPRYE